MGSGDELVIRFWFLKVSYRSGVLAKYEGEFDVPKVIWLIGRNENGDCDDFNSGEYSDDRLGVKIFEMEIDEFKLLLSLSFEWSDVQKEIDEESEHWNAKLHVLLSIDKFVQFILSWFKGNRLNKKLEVSETDGK
jgi:hypothetical protein